jgi:hypothetical protein
MALPTLTPSSTTSAIVLTVTGSHSNVDSASNPLPFGIYTNAAPTTAAYNAFVSGAVDQVAHTYKKLGGDVLDIELTQYQVYAAYEESCLEYSYIINLHQAKNVLGDVLGNTTASFDQDGMIKSGQSLSGSNVALRYPRFQFEYARRVADGVSKETGIGGLSTEYSASFDLTASVQDYDLQTIISSSAASDSDAPFYNKVGNKKVYIKHVYYKTPQAMWRFYGYYGGLNVVGNLSTYGQYADDSTFQLVPSWQNKSQAMAYEDAIYTRISHWSYELKNNNLRIFPRPSSLFNGKTMWVKFMVQEDAWDEDTDKTIGAQGINNANTLPFENIPYENINSIGKQWIRRFALALAKEMLGLVRSKFSSIPIPNESLTLNGDALVTQGKEEQDKLREELKTTLEEITYAKLAETNSAVLENTSKVMQNVPAGIYVG